MNRTSYAAGPLSAVVAAAAAAALLTAARPGAAHTLPVSPIDGRWTATMSRAALMRTGEADEASALRLYGPYTARFANGRFEIRNGRTDRGAAGTFTISGKHVRFVFAYGVGIERGEIAVCAQSVYRDRLTFTKVPGRPCLAWNAAVWTRAK
jgi:hypothetical protein